MCDDKPDNYTLKILMIQVKNISAYFRKNTGICAQCCLIEYTVMVCYNTVKNDMEDCDELVGGYGKSRTGKA